MFEFGLRGPKEYWSWLLFLALVITFGGIAYWFQYSEGLVVTGMSRDVSWGLYIAQLTFLVGVAASAVMLVLPYYLHDCREFGKLTILGEFLAIGAITMCGLFVLVDIGQPRRFLNLFIHANPRSPIFWDIIALTGYLFLNLIIGFSCLKTEYYSLEPPPWLKPLIYVSIPWAISIHTITAFLYAGLPGRSYWLTAIMAPRFLASAFAAGPSLLILLSLFLKKYTHFDAGDRARQTLAKIVVYAIIAHIFLFLLEVFTVYYSQIPSHMVHFEYLYFGIGQKNSMVSWMWTALASGVIAIVLLIVPRYRKNVKSLAAACFLVLVCTWIDKGLGMMAGGFVPNPMDEIIEYSPTFPEISITIGIYGIGTFIVTILYKIALHVSQRDTSEPRNFSAS